MAKMNSCVVFIQLNPKSYHHRDLQNGSDMQLVQ